MATQTENRRKAILAVILALLAAGTLCVWGVAAAGFTISSPVVDAIVSVFTGDGDDRTTANGGGGPGTGPDAEVDLPGDGGGDTDGDGDGGDDDAGNGDGEDDDVASAVTGPTACSASCVSTPMSTLVLMAPTTMAMARLPSALPLTQMSTLTLPAMVTPTASWV